MLHNRSFLFGVILTSALVLSYCGVPSALADGPESTLLTYSTVEQLLSGDLLHSVTLDEVADDLEPFPDDWTIVGVGTTDWAGRNGEMMPDGVSDSPRFWWADPGTGGVVGEIHDLAQPGLGEDDFPFMAIAVGDPATAQTWSARDVPDVHVWLEEQLAQRGIDLAGVQLRGEFGPVSTSIAYNLPLTGLDLSGGYVGDDYFRFADYVTATWTLDGLYAAAPDLQPIISTPNHPLHLHGYQPETMRGGHIGKASVISATVTVWPLTQLVTHTLALTGGAD